MTKLKQAFEDFHAQNPGVYELFKRFTFELIQAGRTYYSSDAVCHRIRWHTAIETEGDDFKINNDYTAYYARKFMRDFPEYKGFFRVRSVAAERKTAVVRSSLPLDMHF